MPEMIDALRTRRTVPAAFLGDPGPSEAQLARILEAGLRVPDHGKLGPWRLIVYPRAEREAAVAALVAMIPPQDDPVATKKRSESSERFAKAALTIGVVSSPDLSKGKVPEWEQQLSAAAVCMNLLHAAQAEGFAAQWLTEWFAYDEGASAYLGRRGGERFAGFIHIGTPTVPPVERDRPKPADVTTVWSASAAASPSRSARPIGAGPG